MIRIPDLPPFSTTPSAGSKLAVWDAATDRTYKIDPGNAVDPLALTGYYNVKDYGAVGDGVTDDTAAIQAAQDAMTTTYGGILFFPFGRYKISGPINITRYGVTLLGSGRGQNNNLGSQIVGGVDHDLIRNTGFGFFSIRNMAFYRPSTGNTTDSKHVALTNCGSTIIDNCYFQNIWNGILIDACSGVTISNCEIRNFIATSGTTYGVCASDASGASLITRIVGCNFYGINNTAGSTGILSLSGDSAYVSSCVFTKLATGIKLAAGSGPTSAFWHILQCETENCDDGLLIDSSTRFYCTDVQVALSNNSGFTVGPTAAGQGSFVGCMSVNNDRHGFFFNGVTGGSYNLTGCIASGNSQEAFNSYDGVNITNSDNITITGGRFGGGGGNSVPTVVTQRNGVRVNGAAIVGVSLTGVNLEGNNATYFTSATQPLMISGCRGVDVPFVLPAYTVAGVPSAATNIRGMIYVTNESGGAVPAFSDGTNWRRVTDRAIVS